MSERTARTVHHGSILGPKIVSSSCRVLGMFRYVMRRLRNRLSTERSLSLFVFGSHRHDIPFLRGQQGHDRKRAADL